MDEIEEPVVAVLDAFEALHPRGCVWGAADQCFVWGQNSNTVHEQRTAHVFGAALELLREWHSIFVAVQSAALTSSDSSSSPLPSGPSLVECSSRYRKSLETFLHAESEKAKQKDPELLQSLHKLNVPLMDYFANLALLEDLKSLWHITDMLFVDPARNITASLVNWVQKRVEPPAVPLDENGRASPSEQFWSSLARLTLLGHYKQVVHALYSAGVWVRPEVSRSVEELFRQDPSLQDSTLSEGEYRARFQSWQADVTAAQDALNENSRQGVGLLFGVLKGDPSVLRDTASRWEEHFIGQVRFCRPYVAKDGLWRLAEGCGEPQGEGLSLLCCPPEQQEKVLQKTLVYLMEKGCPRWLTVHLLDLLSHAIPHSRRRKQQAVWRERELLEYGTSIMQHPVLWELAVDYFLACPAKGISALRVLIEVQPLRSDVEAQRLLPLCDRFGFPDLRRGICSQRANACLKARAYGPAAKWLCEAQDVQRLSALSVFLCGVFMDSLSRRTEAVDAKCGQCSGPVLQDWAASGNSVYHGDCLHRFVLEAISSVVEQVGPENFNLHYSLPFLMHFQQLCEALQRIEKLQRAEVEDMQERSLAEQRRFRADTHRELEQLSQTCLGIIVRALASKVAPRRLWVFLLHSSVRVLETTREARCLLNQADTLKLLGCLEELALSHRHFVTDEHNVKAIRLGLTRNLARAIKNGC